ncbi:hypothetical protein EBZ37_13300, partial [bacterium]|nr:hypothetical protein [bacterium]
SLLAAALGASKLTRLFLSQNNIGDEGASALARVLKSTSLTKLELDQNQIGNPGAADLLAGLANTGITHFSAEHNGFDEHLRKELREATTANYMAQFRYPVMQLSLSIVDERRCEVKCRTLGGNVVFTHLANSTLDSEQLYMDLRKYFDTKVWPIYVLPNGSPWNVDLRMSIAELFTVE